MTPPRLASPLLSVAVLLSLAAPSMLAQTPSAPVEAPTGFDNRTNGFVDQAAFDEARGAFEEQEQIADGLGSVYNAQSCAECHQNPVTGAISQVTELRAWHLGFFGNFIEAPGGSLIQDRAIDASIQERVPDLERFRTFRTSLNTLGDGFVEAIDSNALIAISARQASDTLGRIRRRRVSDSQRSDPPACRRGDLRHRQLPGVERYREGTALHLSQVALMSRLF